MLHLKNKGQRQPFGLHGCSYHVLAGQCQAEQKKNVRLIISQ